MCASQTLTGGQAEASSTSAPPSKPQRISKGNRSISSPAASSGRAYNCGSETGDQNRIKVPSGVENFQRRGKAAMLRKVSILGPTNKKRSG